MIYLIDSSVLITANNSYYPIDKVPEFWEWITYQARQNKVKIPLDIYEELIEGNQDDLLYIWAKENKNILVVEKVIDPKIIQKILDEGYALNLTDDEIEQIGRDPFMTAYALSYERCCVVTAETAAPKKLRSNRKMPDVCKAVGVECCDTFRFIRQLDFNTSWKQKVQDSDLVLNESQVSTIEQFAEEVE